MDDDSKKYIGLIQEERNDDFTFGYGISPESSLPEMLKWRKEMLECSNIIDCKIFEITEIKKYNGKRNRKKILN